ncbi:hypothetical protein LMG33818_001932 [Halomonadaceae bacterium LMG 33818]|uniref:DUF192 domain-containing protein n=1 Tax=Cernens ardua TaxID=3402176 RepID=UPI003EDC9424
MIFGCLYSFIHKNVFLFINECGKRRWLAGHVCALIMLPLLIAVNANAEGTRIAFKTNTGAEWVDVALATTPYQRAMGLMEQTHLPPHSGMLFVYEGEVQPGAAGYWMFHTRIPLDIAFIGPDSRIIKTFTMPPCHADNPSHCPIYRPGKPYLGVLEMPGGYFAQHAIHEGDILGEGRNLLD